MKKRVLSFFHVNYYIKTRPPVQVKHFHTTMNQVWSQEENEEELKEPEMPTNCCGCNCVNCVWNDYFQEMEHYREQLKRRKQKQMEKTRQEQPQTSVIVIEKKKEDLISQQDEEDLKIDLIAQATSQENNKQ